MLTKYIQAAMRQANYEIFPDDGTFYGEIPICQGVYANASTLDACREELQEVLEDWILLSLTEGDTMEEVMANLKDAIEGWLDVANSCNALESTDRVVEIAV